MSRASASEAAAAGLKRRLLPAAAVVGGAAAAGALAYYVHAKRRTRRQQEEEDEEELDAGMLLLEAAADEPDLLPLAFLLNSIVKDAAVDEDGDANTFAALQGILEVLLLTTAVEPSRQALGEIREQLEHGGRRVRREAAAPTYAAICAALQGAVNQLTFEEGAALAGVDAQCFARAVFSRPEARAGDAASEAEMGARIKQQRREQTREEEESRQLEERNKQLQQQLEQMREQVQQLQQQMQSGGSGGVSSSGGAGSSAAGGAAAWVPGSTPLLPRMSADELLKSDAVGQRALLEQQRTSEDAL